MLLEDDTLTDTSAQPVRPIATLTETFFDADEIIVSKTDTKGRITYANRVFIKMSGYTEAELLGKPHSIIRHPDMPRCVFKLLWDVISSGNEIFAYVKNLSAMGSYYWVHAHVSPTRDAAGRITGYHSNRRVPNRAAVKQMEALYLELHQIEARSSNWREGMANAEQALLQRLKQSGVQYDEFIFSLEE